MALSLPLAIAAGDTYYTFYVVPETPMADQPFQIRVVTQPNMCVPLSEQLGVQQAGNVVHYKIFSSDACYPPNLPAEDKTYPVPPLPSGTYTFRFEVCGFQPTDESPDGFRLLEERAASVFGTTDTRFTVPTLSLGSRLTLVVGVLVLGGSATRRSQD